jgi:hypothetical protein
MEEMRNAYKISARTIVGKILSGSPMHRCKGNIKVYLQETWCDWTGFIQLRKGLEICTEA